MEKQPHANNLCGAKTRQATPCKNRAMSNGRCRMHGGKSTGPPKNNKNAIKTGEHEAIWIDILEDDEKELYNQVQLDKIKQIDSEIKLTEIRERRMLQRIQRLQESDYTIVSISTKSFEIESEKSDGPKVSEETEKKEGTLGQIQNIEDALTRVQGHKAKLIDLKHRLESDMGVGEDNTDTIKEFIKATKPSKEDLVALFQDDDDEDI